MTGAEFALLCLSISLITAGLMTEKKEKKEKKEKYENIIRASKATKTCRAKRRN